MNAITNVLSTLTDRLGGTALCAQDDLIPAVYSVTIHQISLFEV